MKKGINIWSFQKDSLAECFALAKDAGFEGVELALAEDGEIALKTSEKELLSVRRQAADAGIELYSLSSGLYWQYSLTDPDPVKSERAADIVKNQLETAAILGCDTILVIPGAVEVDFAPELGVNDYSAVYDAALNELDRLKGFAKGCGVSIGLENVWNRFLTSPIEMRDFLDKIGSEFVGSYFDVGNVVYNGEPEHWIRALGPRIKKVHFKDYRRSVGTLDGFVDLLAGDVNWPEVTAAFKDIGYDGWVSAEMIPSYKFYPDTIIYNTSHAMDAILGR